MALLSSANSVEVKIIFTCSLGFALTNCSNTGWALAQGPQNGLQTLIIVVVSPRFPNEIPKSFQPSAAFACCIKRLLNISSLFCKRLYAAIYLLQSFAFIIIGLIAYHAIMGNSMQMLISIIGKVLIIRK